MPSFRLPAHLGGIHRLQCMHFLNVMSLLKPPCFAVTHYYSFPISHLSWAQTTGVTGQFDPDSPLQKIGGEICSGTSVRTDAQPRLSGNVSG